MKTSSLKAIGAIITIALALSIGFMNNQTNETTKPNNAGGGLMAVYNLDLLGKDVTASEAKNLAELGLPTYLPAGTSSPQIKLRENSSLAALIYTNPNLKRLIGYQQDVQIVILAEKDGTSFADYLKPVPKPTVTVTTTKDGKEEVRTVNIPMIRLGMNRSSEVSIAGNPGYGYDPMDTPQYQDSGRVQWWSKDGTHYQILADLPLQELLKIARSMPSM